METEGLNANVELVTPETASKLLEHYQFENQRRLVDWQVNRLAKEMARGNFKPTSIVVAHCEETNTHHLLDGQHRLAAIRVYNHPVALFVNRIQVKTQAELNAWYGDLDRNRIRNLSDGLKVLNVAEETGIPEYYLRHFSSALRVIADGFQSAKIHSSERAEDYQSITVRAQWLRDWQEEAQKTLTATEGAVRAIRDSLFRQSTLGVVLVTFRYQPEMAELFWKSVSENDGLKRGEATHTLYSYLIGERVTKIKSAVNINSRQVANCWNAFVDGRELFRTFVKEPRFPIIIRGTPYDGKQIIRLSAEGEQVTEKFEKPAKKA